MALAGVMGQGRQLVVRGKDLWVMLGLGLSLTCSAGFGWAALQIMDPTFSACLGRLVPVMVIVIGMILFKDRIRLPEWVAVAVMVCGGALSTLGGTWGLEWWGITLTLIASFFTALQLTIGKLGSATIPSLVLNLYRTVIAAILLLCFSLVIGKFDMMHAQPRHWAGLLIGAVLGPCLGVSLIYGSYRYWNVSRTAMILTLQPLSVLPMAFLVLHEVPGFWKLIGGLVILVGGLWLVLLHRPTHAKPPVADEPKKPDEIAPAACAPTDSQSPTRSA